MLLLSSSFLLQLFKTKSPKIASWPGILVCHKETRIKVVLARKLGKQGHGSSPVLFQYIHWPVPRGRGTGRFPPARHWSVNVMKQDNHQSPYFQLEIPFGSTKISGINKVYTFIWNDFWTLRNFWRSSIQFLIPRIIVRISLIFSRWTIGNDCLFSWSHLETLPKAQRTRGLSSYHKFKHKSWSNFIFRISTKHHLQNLNQTSASP